jgi:CheY-like chemotaxis protein
MSHSHGSPNLPWVVLVEDDESLQRELAGALERALPEVEVQRTPDPEEALAWARDMRSRLLITEQQSLSVDGLTLAACVRQQRPQLPLIFLAEHAPHRPLNKSFDGSHLVDKPPQLDAFVRLVSRVLHHAPGFHGQIETSGLMDLVQLVAMTTPTGALHVESSGGAGSVWFEDGSIVHAAFGRERGSAAFRDMLRLPSGNFHVEALVNAPERTIHTNITGFLLETACSLDDDCQSGVRAHGMTAAEYFERGLQCVRAKRYADALPEWEQATALDPENRIYQHNLLRLQRLLETGASQIHVRR